LHKQQKGAVVHRTKSSKLASFPTKDR